ncbi:class I SAM-dependent methyltransferase [Cognatilysobacter lacus]|uniref:Methyltransferase domain-containing protein n=1 Tax=Cognatilysobacter lacus TaxID=1643323 RepID=A0A5D8Z5E9_9GAMM|nr:class I SAM-dependent methyltransferase [Lysobacter lacus]TZF89756.1 methyltransferase domain-containing protein [Lysobacter lacus]
MATLTERLLRVLRSARAVEEASAATHVADEGAAAEPLPLAPETSVDPYQARMDQERAIFVDQTEVHDLPPIFHYWSNRYLLPMQQPLGVRNPEQFLARYLHESARRTGSSKPRFVSLGCGNCDAETRIARELVELGLDDFTLECLDINEAMLERGAQIARASGLETRVIPLQADLNRWEPLGSYDGIMANQSLHHVLELEHLFDAVLAALAPRALFAVSDMIGRNGHQRWPEALAIVREFWRELPGTYRFNRQLQRQEDEFQDWDCSNEGFEGIRAQDILPLLSVKFGFEVFVGFGNIIDPFIDRGFGHHFDVTNPWDTDFIDRVHARDEAEMRAGRITPTHMLAVLSTDRGTQCYHRPGLSVAHCLRAPSGAADDGSAESGARASDARGD